MTIEEINVVYSTDDNYAMHAGISIISLMENNKDISRINVYIINDKISKENTEKLNEITKNYSNAYLEFIDFDIYRNKLNLNMEWEISLASYARLFLSSMLPKNVRCVLYLDCDTIIDYSLKELFETNIEEYCIAGVQDTVNSLTKENVSVQSKQKYVNAGILLINLAKWREDNAEQRFLDFIDKFNGKVTHHDQGVINGCYGKKCLFLPIKYNFMTIHYFFNKRQLLKYFSDEAEYYSEKEINDAKSNPIIYHFTPSFTSRPWVKGCVHPKRGLYFKYLDMSPWKGYQCIRNNSKWYVKLIEWRYRKLPF